MTPAEVGSFVHRKLCVCSSCFAGKCQLGKDDFFYICTGSTQKEHRRQRSTMTTGNYGIRQHTQTVKLAEQCNTRHCIQSTASAQALEIDEQRP